MSFHFTESIKGSLHKNTCRLCLGFGWNLQSLLEILEEENP